MIYFLQRSNGDIKIGTTVDFQSRLAQLEALHGKLVLLGALEGSYETEGRLHERFRHLRVLYEWHRNDPELTDFIISLKPVDINSSEVKPRLASNIQFLAHKESEFAYRLGITENELDSYMYGISVPSLDLIVHMAALAKVSIDWMLRGDYFPESDTTTEYLEKKVIESIYNGKSTLELFELILLLIEHKDIQLKSRSGQEWLSINPKQRITKEPSLT